MNFRIDYEAVFWQRGDCFATLLFMDYQQIEAAPGHTALYSKVTQDTAYGRIPLEIPPLPAGKHHLLVLRINTPGVPMCLLINPTARTLPNSVTGALVGVEVLPPK